MAYDQLWDQLAAEPPAEVCRRTGALYDEETGEFLLPVLTGTLLITPAMRCVEWLEPGAGAAPGPPDQAVEVAATAYLLSMEEPARAEEWISPLDLPSGTFFFRGPHGLPTAPLESAFGDCPEVFRAAAEALGGTPLPLADAAYRLVVFPYLPVAVLLWRGDDEFPARVRFLVDRTAGRQLLLDALLAAVGEVTNRLLRLGAEAG